MSASRPIRLLWRAGLKPLSSPVSFQITACVFHGDGRHCDVTAVCRGHGRVSSASLLSLPGFDLKGGREEGEETELTEEPSRCHVTITDDWVIHHGEEGHLSSPQCAPLYRVHVQVCVTQQSQVKTVLLYLRFPFDLCAVLFQPF